MEKRKILVSSSEQALGLMKAFLVANMLDNDLAVFDGKIGESRYKIKFGWFSRDLENDDEVGCPCFVCDYEGVMPGSTSRLKGIVYVKIFASKDANLTKMLIDIDKKRFHFEEIQNGQCFQMQDPLHRYEDETFVYKDGDIIRK